MSLGPSLSRWPSVNKRGNRQAGKESLQEPGSASLWEARKRFLATHPCWLSVNPGSYKGLMDCNWMSGGHTGVAVE